MKRFLLDTGPAQHFLNNRLGVRERADEERRRGNRIGICTPVLGELWSGVEGSHSRDQNLGRLRHGLSRLVIWPYDEAAASEYGRVFIELNGSVVRCSRSTSRSPRSPSRSEIAWW